MEPFIFFLIISHAVAQIEPRFDLGSDPQPIPEKCHVSPEFLQRQCCIFPPFFTRDVARACGAAFEVTIEDKKNDVGGFIRRATTGCRHWYCVLEKYDLLTKLGYVDHDKYYNHLDLWVELNPAFSEVMAAAKMNCKYYYRRYFPLKPCDFFTLHTCIRHYINLNCPATIPTKECKELQEYIATCKEYFKK